MIVVAAALIAQDGKILIDQRKRDTRMGLYWEFPGGKLEKGEPPERALERELMEELRIETRTGPIRHVAHAVGEHDDYLLLFYESAITRGEPVAVECERFEWADIGALSRYMFLPADADVVARVARGEIALGLRTEASGGQRE